MADQAQEVAAASGLAIRVLDEADLAREGFGGLVAVGAGSVRPPRLVQLELGSRRDRGTPGTWCWSARASPSTPAACR